MHQSERNQMARNIKRRELALDAFVSQCYLPHVKLRKRSWKIDDRIARHYLSPVFGARPLAEITRNEIDSWLDGLLAAGFAPATCNRILAVFKSICSFAETWGHLQPGASPCRGVSSIKVYLCRERYLSQPEARRLMKYLENSNRLEALAIKLLMLTGARKNEILRAKWENIDMERRILIVPLSKSGKPRQIVLSEAAMAVIRGIPRNNNSPWLFPGHAKDKPLSDLYLFWNQLRRELGIVDARIHDLRHTFASFLVNSGYSLYEVQKMLGHADPRTTMRYAHLGQNTLLEATESVSVILDMQPQGIA